MSDTSLFGKLVRKARTEQEIGVRELARRIERSPARVVRLEHDERPCASDFVILAVSRELGLDSDRMFVLADKTPPDLRPHTPRMCKLYRAVRELDLDEQRRLLEEMR